MGLCLCLVVSGVQRVLVVVPLLEASLMMPLGTLNALAMQGAFTPQLVAQYCALLFEMVALAQLV